MADQYDLYELEDLEVLEYTERRSVFNYESRNNDLDELDETDFRRRYRFNKSTIEELISVLNPELSSITDRNRALSPTEKVLGAIKYFSFGTHQINIGDLHQISQPSACRAINDVATALAKLKPRYIYLPQTEAERIEISRKFYEHFGFPGVYGAVDCSLIKILSPGGDQAERFRSRKGTFALNVQTMSDADLFCRNIVTRWPGSTHDSTIFDHSYLRAHLETEVPSQYHLLGDSGYPLRSYLMTPFLNPVSASQTRYNNGHAKGRNVVERQYGVWKRRFACISVPLRCDLQNAQTIIVATAVLHNLALTLGDVYEEDFVEQEEDDLTTYPQTNIAGIAKRNSIVANFFS